MFDKDIRHFRPTPRSLNDAFGPYARLSVHKRKPRISARLWVIAYGVAVAFIWYGIVFVRAA